MGARCPAHRRTAAGCQFYAQRKKLEEVTQQVPCPTGELQERWGCWGACRAAWPSLAARPQHWGMNRKGEKYQKPKQAPNNTYLIICLEDQVIPGSKPRNGNKSFILTLHSTEMLLPTSMKNDAHPCNRAKESLTEDGGGIPSSGLLSLPPFFRWVAMETEEGREVSRDQWQGHE